MIIGENLGPLPAIPEFFQTIKNKALNTLNIHFKNGTLTVQGELPNQEVKNNLLAAIKSSFGSNIIDKLTIAPLIEKTDCQNLVNDVLGKAKINFETGSAVIASTSYSLLNEIASISQRCPSANFEISGHTDSSGSLQANVQLSQARAQAVVTYLTRLGLHAERFNAKGYGPNVPIADNSTIDGRAQNRRIEFKLQN